MNIEKIPGLSPQNQSSETQTKTDPVRKEMESQPTQDSNWARPTYSPFGNSRKKEDCYVPNFSSDTYIPSASASADTKQTNTQADWEKIHGNFDIKFA